ncbi:hypothetical protein ZHAS_00011964 [Anopheles sinensis]|uniref:Uncharacterized protein n=1 Tax=Anopheles sinensis TaxID=74873 RepID=A0A084W1K9_ANOSI|nr:hypothetical protein ZHAS_00011964 [Anopheles sinensis]
MGLSFALLKAQELKTKSRRFETTCKTYNRQLSLVYYLIIIIEPIPEDTGAMRLTLIICTKSSILEGEWGFASFLYTLCSVHRLSNLRLVHRPMQVASGNAFRGKK